MGHCMWWYELWEWSMANIGCINLVRLMRFCWERLFHWKISKFATGVLVYPVYKIAWSPAVATHTFGHGFSNLASMRPTEWAPCWPSRRSAKPGTPVHAAASAGVIRYFHPPHSHPGMKISYDNIVTISSPPLPPPPPPPLRYFHPPPNQGNIWQTYHL